MPGRDGTGPVGGQGRGRMGGAKAGIGGECVCPSCGHREPHKRGEPCAEKACPKCNARMVRAT
ncbi:MAG: hypothetical protein GX139_04405 [Armatimonadetes bacterium]|nr:hypothetical protein [Armatimonadota bacterium]